MSSAGLKLARSARTTWSGVGEGTAGGRGMGDTRAGGIGMPRMPVALICIGDAAATIITIRMY